MSILRNLLLLSAVISLNAGAVSMTDSITVTGRFSGIADDGRRSLIINECDICEKSVRRFVELDSSGCFSEKIPLSYGHTFTIAYGRNFIECYAEPGDSVHIEADASVTPVGFHVSGDHAGLNEEFSHAAQNLNKIYFDVSLPNPKTPVSGYLQAFKNEVAAKQAIIDSYVADNDVSAEAAEMLRMMNVFSIANQAIDYIGEEDTDARTLFTDSIFDIYNEDNARVMIFPYHLSALCRRSPDIIGRTPKGLIRDLMYAAISEDTVPLRSDFADTAYYDRIYGKTRAEIDLTKVGRGSIIVYRSGKPESFDGAKPLDWLRSEYGGRPVYLDISATWCGPCRASLSESEDIRQKFKDTDMVFAVLWLKSDRDSWAQFVPTVNNAVHIFVENDEMSDALMAAFNLQGFPTCYFMDRKGEITADGVPRFHNPELYDFLKAGLR